MFLTSPPQELPITRHKDAIVTGIRDHQVIVVAGDTGSGKTTQLPKFCLEAGRGVSGMIGCTQPRRIAAVSIAERVNEEMNGGVKVGYKIRFHDHTEADTVIAFMTDGILLAETQTDPTLAKYDTLIIDEAHERSLNIDFLLGILKQLLRNRPDLKLIIASATIDTDKFSAHFDNAPVFTVSGRNYPIAIEYSPLASEEEIASSEEAETYPEAAIRHACRLVAETRSGDILIFMPTERDIRDCIKNLTAQLGNSAEVLPLFGRLQAGDQRLVFHPSPRRKIIVATNIAETSITVPGIRFVIDTGLARISKYNVRARTTSLLVSKISRASCDQRAGRSGRTGPGLCIRLYAKEDYEARSEFTLPEIRRSNLAEVLLKMISLDLGDPKDFPFLEPPAARAISDGYKLLRELGALKKNHTLSESGKVMASLPLDPCISKMILTAINLNALKEVKIIAAALSIMDPRIRPADSQEKADAAHSTFLDKRSDFLGFLNIWNSYQDLADRLSASKLKKFCKANFLSWQRMREWFDVYEQISRILGNKKQYRENSEAASYEAVHEALASGLLRNICLKKEKNIYQASGGREVMLFPGSALYHGGGQWLIAASFVETSRLFARTAAVIDASWLERLGGENCRKSWSEPHWEKRSGQVVALEKVTLFGLPIVTNRRVNYGRTGKKAAQEARALFIRSALIPGELSGNYPFLLHNLELCQKLASMEDKVRRRGILVDEETLFSFYDSVLGKSVYDRFTLNQFLKGQQNDQLLRMDQERISTAIPARDELYRFPASLQTKAGPLKLRYRFEPGHAEDGVCVEIPAALADTVDPLQFEWLVPGLLEEKILFLLKALPKRVRRLLVPLPEAVDRIMDALDVGQGSLYPALEKAIFKLYHVTVQRCDWQANSLAPHLRMGFYLARPDGTFSFAGRSFQDVREQIFTTARTSDHRKPTAGNLPETDRIDVRDFDTIPPRLHWTTPDSTQQKMYFPALRINQKEQTLGLRYLEDPSRARQQNREGMRFLYCQPFSGEVKKLQREIKQFVSQNTATFLALGAGLQANQLIDAISSCFLDVLFETESGTIPDNAAHDAIIRRVQEQNLFQAVRRDLQKLAKILAIRKDVVATLAEAERNALRSKNYRQERFDDYRQHLEGILPSAFLQSGRLPDLEHTDRYLKALQVRIMRAEQDPLKDEQKAKRLEPQYKRLHLLETMTFPGEECRTLATSFTRMVAEFVVSVFAPELGTAMPISEKRLQNRWSEVEEACRNVE